MDGLEADNIKVVENKDDFVRVTKIRETMKDIIEPINKKNNENDKSIKGAIATLRDC